MSKENRKNKPVSFNTKDEYDLMLLTHAEKINPLTGKPRNFSKYIKRLIEDDMKPTSNKGVIVSNSATMIDDNAYSSETKEAMSSFI